MQLGVFQNGLAADCLDAEYSFCTLCWPAWTTVGSHMPGMQMRVTTLHSSIGTCIKIVPLGPYIIMERCTSAGSFFRPRNHLLTFSARYAADAAELRAVGTQI